MSAAAPAPKKGIIKLIVGGSLGLATGAVGMYFNAAFNTLVKPAKPLANFVASADGLTVTCENRASGQSGYWDFGGGTALEAFDAAAQTVKHAYAKPGNYSVKLTVRNFLMEENDRSVSVEIAPAAAATTAANAPRILDLKVEPIRDQVPATYRITGRLQNADEIIWRLGDKTEHLSAPGELIDRYVTFDTEGEKPIVLTALSKGRQDPQVIVQAVAVKKPTTDSYDAMVIVTDAMVKVEQKSRTVQLPMPVKDAAGPTKGFQRVLAAGWSSTILKAQIDPSTAKLVRNPRAEIARDGKSVAVSGEWTASGDDLARLAGGSDVMVPVLLVEEVRRKMDPVRQVLSGFMGADQMIAVKLPPKPSGMMTRSVSVDFGASRREGGRKSYATGPLDANGAWTSSPFDLGGQQIVVKAATVNDVVQLTFVRAK